MFAVSSAPVLPHSRPTPAVLVVTIGLALVSCLEWVDFVTASPEPTIVVSAPRNEAGLSLSLTSLGSVLVVLVSSTCAGLSASASLYSAGYLLFCSWLCIGFRSLSCVEGLSPLPAIASLISAIVQRPLLILLHIFFILAWAFQAAILFLIIEAFYRVKLILSVVSSAVLTGITLFSLPSLAVDASVLCRLCLLGFALVALLPVTLELFEYLYPILSVNAPVHTLRWAIDWASGWRLTARLYQRIGRPVSAFSPPSAPQPPSFLSRPAMAVPSVLDSLYSAAGKYPGGTSLLRRASSPDTLSGALVRGGGPGPGPVLGPAGLETGVHVKKTLVLDLDETLVHSSTRPPLRMSSDLVFNIAVGTELCVFYVLKRPFVDWFLRQVCEWYDVVIFTASLRKYADPVIDMLGKNGAIARRLFRDEGSFMKDITTVCGDLARVVIVDNSPCAFQLQRDNGVHIEGWYDDPRDKQLLAILPLLYALRDVDDVRPVLHSWRGRNPVPPFS